MTGSTAARDKAALRTSSLPAFGFLCSGSSTGPTMSNNTMTGIGARNTAPHQKCARIRPPTAGPMAPPSEKLATQTLTANVLSRSSRNMLLISDSVEGANVAPAIPSRARAAMSVSALRAKAATSDRSPKEADPISSSFRRPIRSPRVPMTSSDPAARKPYTSTIHNNCAAVGFRSALRDGTARFRIVRSIAYRMQGSAMVASPIHSRRVALPVLRPVGKSDVFIAMSVRS